MTKTYAHSFFQSLSRKSPELFSGLILVLAEGTIAQQVFRDAWRHLQWNGNPDTVYNSLLESPLIDTTWDKRCKIADPFVFEIKRVASCGPDNLLTTAHAVLLDYYSNPPRLHRFLGPQERSRFLKWVRHSLAASEQGLDVAAEAFARAFQYSWQSACFKVFRDTATLSPQTEKRQEALLAMRIILSYIEGDYIEAAGHTRTLTTQFPLPASRLFAVSTQIGGRLLALWGDEHIAYAVLQEGQRISQELKDRELEVRVLGAFAQGTFEQYATSFDNELWSFLASETPSVQNTWRMLIDRSSSTKQPLLDIPSSRGERPETRSKGLLTHFFRLRESPQSDKPAGAKSEALIRFLDNLASDPPSTREEVRDACYALLACALWPFPYRVNRSLLQLYEKRNLEGSYLGMELRECLRDALVRNQVDATLQSAWEGMLLHDRSDDFLLGDTFDGLRGLRAIPTKDASFVNGLAHSLRSVIKQLHNRYYRRRQLRGLLDSLFVHSSPDTQIEWSLLLLANREDWPRWAVECLPKLCFRPAEHVESEEWVLWWPVAVVVQKRWDLGIIEWLCSGTVARMLIPAENVSFLQTVAETLESRRLQNPYASHRAVLGDICDAFQELQKQLRGQHAEDANAARVLEHIREEIFKQLHQRRSNPHDAAG